MRKQISDALEIPAGISCEVKGRTLICKKDGIELSRTLDIPNISLEIKDSKVILESAKGNQMEFKVIKSFIAHAKNMFYGIDKKFIYQLEACNLHFPMTLKLEKDQLIINNFLGEKVPRRAKVLPNVEIDIKGNKITLSARDREAGGQTAANIEKATRIRYRDRRIFQDGIFITHKPEDVE